MGASFVALAITLSMSVGQNDSTIKKDEVDYQNEVFQRWWEADLTWTFDDLPTEGTVPDFRIPYSGHDYPDRAGGTIKSLQKYDQAFHPGELTRIEVQQQQGGQTTATFGRLGRRFASRPATRTVVHRGGPAVAFEAKDTTGFKEPTTQRAGLLGRRSITVQQTPHWHGHCNGWTSAAIRHAEPQTSVTRNGVVFTPADIKGLLAEIYMYRDNEFLGGEDDRMNPALLHVVLANWLGRGSHPVGIETAVGKEKWNYPLYAFKTSHRKISDNEIEVSMNAAYSLSTKQEFDRSQHINKTIYFHYSLELNDDGEIVGGSYYNDSSVLDMLWTGLQPVQGGTAGNDRGNPHLDVKEVLAIWRESVPAELRNKWLNIDPTEEDAIDFIAEDEAADSADEAAPADDSDSGVAGDQNQPSAEDASAIEGTEAIASSD